MEFLPSNTKSQQCSKWIGHECFSLFARLLQICVCMLFFFPLSFEIYIIFFHIRPTEDQQKHIRCVWISCFYEAKRVRERGY